MGVGRQHLRQGGLTTQSRLDEISATGKSPFVGLSSVNILLQGLTLASKSLLLLFLARYLTPTELGVFGLLVVTLNLSMYVVGLDFYAFNTRELLRRGREEAPRLIRDQGVFHAITYLLVLPPLLLIFRWGVLPWDLLLLFYGLLVLDHIAQELQRILISLHRPIHAAVLFFLRGGLWVYAVLGVMTRDPATRTVHAVALGWLLGVALSLVAAGIWLRDLPWKGSLDRPVDWAWLRGGLLVSLPFLSATLALRGILSVDRYALQYFWGAEAVGVYTFYASMRNAIQSILDMGVLAILRPRIIAAYQGGQTAQYRLLMRQLRIGVGGLTVGMCALAGLAIYPLLGFVGNPVYAHYLPAYWVMLGVTLVAALADIPHTELYARHLDGAIVLSTVAGLCAAVALNLLFVPRYGILGSALATLLACALVGVGKSWFLRRSRQA